ncbi:tyrosine-protein kinase SRK3-like [Oscarella lobularis]|uniref:tyrosine-protein kinase SRK3-like n=1 Tax=Oscarella lobularis TaxID=121494 RepID=UPI0033143542
MDGVPDDDATLRARLISFGENPGPINDSTRELYRKKLKRLLKGKKEVKKQPKQLKQVEKEKTEAEADGGEGGEGGEEGGIFATLLQAPYRLYRGLFGQDDDVDEDESEKMEVDVDDDVRNDDVNFHGVTKIKPSPKSKDLPTFKLPRATPRRPLRASAAPRVVEKPAIATMATDWELDPSTIVISRRANGFEWKLGQGGFGVVYRAVMNGIDPVAVKCLKVGVSASVVEQFRDELALIACLRHRHIVQFYGACTRPDNLFMVTELMETDLFSALRSSHSDRYKWGGTGHGRAIVRGIAAGLHYLHSKNPPVVHRDLKSPNILLSSTSEGCLAKIADIGLARTKLNTLMTPQPGYTPAWSAPEVVYRERTDEKVDVWSWGILLWEVVTGRVPSHGELVMPVWCGYELSSLFDRCRAREAWQRPSALEIVKNVEPL